MSSPFASPGATGGGIDLDALNGALLLIEPHGVKTAVMTVYGVKDPMVADVAVLDGPHAGDEHAGAFIFPTVLIDQLRPNIGQKVLGRLGQGPAKPGQRPPWILLEATEADEKIGVAYLTRTQLARPAQTSGQSGQFSDAPPF